MKPEVRLFIARARTITLLIAFSAAGPSFAAASDIPDLIKALRHPLPEKRAEARQALVKAGPKAVARLLEAATNESKRRLHFSILEQMGPRVTIPALLDLLDDERLRSKAGSGLFLLIGPESSHAAAQLLDCLREKPEVKHYCGQALAKSMSPKASAQTGLLTQALGESSSEVRLYAALALGQIAPKNKKAVEALAKVLADSDPSVRLNAALALGKIGGSARTAVPALKKAATLGPEELSRQIEEVIREING
jgi:HEAT repeat protein